MKSACFIDVYDNVGDKYVIAICIDTSALYAGFCILFEGLHVVFGKDKETVKPELKKLLEYLNIVDASPIYKTDVLQEV